MGDPTRITKTYEPYEGNLGEPSETETLTEEWASLDSYEATTNAKGHVQLHIKLYKQPGAEPAAELALKLSALREACKIEGFTIAGDS